MQSWETITTFTYPQEAHMAMSFLESNGIQCMLKDELTAQVYNFNSNAIGGIKLQVLSSDLEAAHQILVEGDYIREDKNSNKQEIELIKMDHAIDKSVCPFCKSNNIAKKRDPNILVVIVYFIIGIIVPLFRPGYQCFDCSKEWKFVK